MTPRTHRRPRVLPAALVTAVVLVVSACGARSGVLDGYGTGGAGSDGGGGSAVGADGGTGGHTGGGADADSDRSAGGGPDGGVVDGGCAGDGCSSQPPGADASTSPAQPDGVCPMFPPTSPASCWPDGLSCTYDDLDGCALTALCTGESWKLFPPNVTGSECTGTLTGCVEGASCQLPMCAVPDDAGCVTTICTCGAAQTYVCYHAVVVPDAGPGCVTAGPCPLPLPPADGQSCADVGFICPYYEDGCETNCICAASGWSCARQQGC